MKQIRFGTGLDNQHDPQQVGANGLVVSVNFDARDDKTAVTRSGYTATTLTGTALHSLWGSADRTYGYVMDGKALFHLAADLTKTSVGDMPSTATVQFVEMLDMVAAISSSAVRFLKGKVFFTPAAFPTFDGETQFLLPMTGLSGSGGAFYNGQFFVATGSSLAFSVAGYPTHYDSRDYLLPMGAACSRVFPADDGLWVSGGGKTSFLLGANAQTMAFKNGLPFGVQSGCLVRLEEIGIEAPGDGHLVASDHGTMLLMNSGQALDLSKGKYHPPLGTGHVSLLRQHNGYQSLLTCFTRTGDSPHYVGATLTVDQASL